MHSAAILPSVIDLQQSGACRAQWTDREELPSWDSKLDEHRHIQSADESRLAVSAYVAYAATVGTLFFFKGQPAPGPLMIVLHVIVATTCYTYVSALSCRSCGAALTDGVLGFGRRCSKCGHLI